jgi:hypothetical protein
MANDTASGEYDQARGTKFKFKAKTKRSRKHDDDDDSHHRSSKRRRSESSSTDKDSHKSSRPHRSHNRKHHSPLADDPAAYDDTYTSNARSTNYLDPDAAFRESLFDAMADDEGAAFWEGVYGQPIHVYPAPPGKEGAQGELEQMGEEEYAEYVRGRMWEKTHQHVLEERERREERRRQRRKEDAAWEREEAEREEREERERKERKRFESKIEASLRRGEERKVRKRWEEAWRRYTDGWEHFASTLATKSKEADSLSGKAGRGLIPWPVESGSWKHAGKEDVEEFFDKAVPADTEMMTVLKVERVRWHPDKMQQRFGANKLDEETLRTVTAVFQVVDRMWGELREKK